jgi:hypothetical protein
LKSKRGGVELTKMPVWDRDKKVREEAQWFCDTKATWPKPCNEHQPTLQELEATTFSDYVRTVVLRKAQLYDNDKDEEEEVVDDNDKKNTNTTTTNHFTRTSSRRKQQQQQQQQQQQFTPSICTNDPPIEYTQGMAKVTLPKGFWDQAGIAQDQTGRGAEWVKGTALGDMELPSPMKQYLRGIGGIYEYTFMDMPPISVDEFRQQADAYFQAQVGAALLKDGNGANGAANGASVEQLERKFWKRLGPTMQPPMYGADMEGTLFGTEECCGWNISKLHSCLQLLLSDPHPQLPSHNKSTTTTTTPTTAPPAQEGIPGVTTPYLYFGMWASVFCAHTEDMHLLSINYLHAGAPKIWYAVAPGEDAKRFEQLCEGHYVDAKGSCSEYLRHKRCLISPHILKKAGIRFTRAVQYPGDAMITFPAGYHFGFNTGFNVAEATNFAVPEWVPYAKLAHVCLCRPDSVRIDVPKFERLFQKYEKDQGRLLQRGGGGSGKLSWKEWAQQRQAKQLLAEQRQESSSSGGNTTTSPTKKNAHKNEFWVEVMQRAASSSGKLTKKQNKKSRKRQSSSDKQKNAVEVDIWHLAKSMTRKSLKPLTRVLCIVPAKVAVVVGNTNKDNENDDDDDDEEEEQCFAGMITEVSQDHVRVHLDGLRKKEDTWMHWESPKLFLDGGRWEEASDLPPRHYWQEEDSKRRCV